MTKNIDTLKAAMETRLAELRDEWIIIDNAPSPEDGLTSDDMLKLHYISAKIEVLESLLNEYCRP